MDPRVKVLVARGKTLMDGPAIPIQFDGSAAAKRLVNDLSGYPHAFVLACILNRQVTSHRAWNAPFELSQRLGGFAFSRLRRLTLPNWQRAMAKPKALHRMPAEMAQNLYEAVDHIATAYDGDAANIWRNEPPSAEVVYRFLAFRGVGPKIATMAANILARVFKIPFSDRLSIDVSADVHVRRVFGRLGLTEKAPSVGRVIYRARALYPTFPGIMDLPAWQIGNEWCRPRDPKCQDCYMNRVCEYAEAPVLCGQPHPDGKGTCVSRADHVNPTKTKAYRTLHYTKTGRRWPVLCGQPHPDGKGTCVSRADHVNPTKTKGYRTLHYTKTGRRW